jgi:aldehyde:ferredoxin oxidoreductase
MKSGQIQVELTGLDLRFGNHEAMITMLHKIAHREGFGDILAEGVKRAAATIGNGAEQYAMHVKGMEMSCFCPRVLKSQALGFSVSSKGPSHNEVRISSECGRDWPLGTFENNMGSLAKTLMDWSAIANSLVWCLSAERLLNITLSEKVPEILHFVTGMDFDQSELIQIADRIHNLERSFNIREGLSDKDDILPQRFFNEEISENNSDGKRIQKESLDKQIQAFYQAMGWDKHGVPSRSRLNSIGLKFVSENLDKYLQKSA